MQVRLERLDRTRVALEVADDGCGMGDRDPPEQSAGSRIVDALVRQLRGELQTETPLLAAPPLSRSGSVGC